MRNVVSVAPQRWGKSPIGDVDQFRQGFAAHGRTGAALRNVVSVVPQLWGKTPIGSVRFQPFSPVLRPRGPAKPPASEGGVSAIGTVDADAVSGEGFFVASGEVGQPTAFAAALPPTISNNRRTGRIAV